MTHSLEHPYRLAGKRVFVAGHRGMVGSTIARRLAAEDCEVMTVSRDRVDLRRQADVEDWMADAKPQAVFLAAARVGGILANDTRPGEFIYDNLMLQSNVIEAARRVGVEKLLFLGSSCIYPRETPQPMSEEHLLTGPPEPTTQWYGVAKIAGIKLCAAYRRQYGCDFISAMPCNLYGENDNFELESSHVLPALIAKAHAARLRGDSLLEVWGTGKPRREFLYVEDTADAMIHLMKHYSGEMHINIGTGSDISIAGLAELISEIVGLSGEIRYRSDRPDGMMLKRLDVARLQELGWTAKTTLRDGIRRTYDWYVEHLHDPTTRPDRMPRAG